jgi:urea carboxylase
VRSPAASSHAAPDGRRVGGGVLGGRCALAARERADEAVASARRARRELSAARRILERLGDRARGDPSGYGFLSENADFAQACAGRLDVHRPDAEQMRSFGLKHTAREIAAANDVPLLPVFVAR